MQASFHKLVDGQNYNPWYKYELFRKEAYMKPHTLKVIVEILDIADVPELILSYISEEDVAMTGPVFPFLFHDTHPISYDIDPRAFFGRLVKTEWEIPEEYANAIAQLVFKSGTKLVQAFSRVECQIPLNWHAKLVSRLIHNGVRVDDGSRTTLEHKNLCGYNRNDDGTLVNRFIH